MAVKKQQQELTFEQKIKRLEDLADMLDEGSSPLEELLEAYKEGMQIALECREYLNSAEQKVIEIGSKYFKENDDNSLF